MQPSPQVRASEIGFISPCFFYRSTLISISSSLRCLEGSTLSNLVHRRRRCARIVLNQILLPGGQYARGQGRSFHQTKESNVAPEEPFLISYLHWLFRPTRDRRYTDLSPCPGYTYRYCSVNLSNSSLWCTLMYASL